MIAVILVAVAYPFAWPRHRDSFPISSYPMFSARLVTPTVKLQYAVGTAADGTRHHLAPELVANDEVLQARAVLARAVAGGSKATRALCEHIASRVATAGGEVDRIIEVRIVTGTHDSVEYLTGRDRVGKERLHGRCPVTRAARGDSAGDRGGHAGQNPGQVP